MNHDEVPLPTNNIRRRSLFDDYNKEVKKESMEQTFPVINSETSYPTEYIGKIRTEIEQWKMNISKTLDEQKKMRAEKLELQNTVFDESILTVQQREELASYNFDEYVRTVQEFCDRAEIFVHKLQYKPERESEERYLAIQKKLENEILPKHSTDSTD